LDCSFFSVFKNGLRNFYIKPEQLKRHEIRKELFKITRKALHFAFFSDTVAEGFKLAGIYPFNPQVLAQNPFVNKVPVSQNNSEKKRKSSRISISNKILTGDTFLKKRQLEEEEKRRKAEEKPKKQQRRKRKRGEKDEIEEALRRSKKAELSYSHSSNFIQKHQELGSEESGKDSKSEQENESSEEE